MINNSYLPTPCRIIKIQRETDVEFTFTLESDMKPEHGQFIEVSLVGAGEAPISVSGFGEGSIDLTIRNVGCLTGRICSCKPGDLLYLRGPYGKPFPAELYRDKVLVIATGGCALAPVRTLIRSRLADPAQARLTRLIFGFKNPESVMFHDEIEQWKTATQVIVTVDSEACTWSGRTGLITRHVPDIDVPDPSSAHAVIVGPPVMMKFTGMEFRKMGFSTSNMWVSFERRMACGLGKCGHCKIDNTYVCVDGPVLRYDAVEQLLD